MRISSVLPLLAISISAVFADPTSLFFKPQFDANTPDVVEIYDIDATLLLLPTPIYLINKAGDIVRLSSEQYDGEYKRARKEPAAHKDYKYLDYTVFREDPTRKFMYKDPVTGLETEIFSSFEDYNSNGALKFLAQCAEMLAKGEANWEASKAPSMNQFLRRLMHPNLARHTYFNTAREHSLEDFYRGFEQIQRYLADVHGIKIYLPARENFCGVGAEARQRGMKNEEVKAERNLQVIQSLQALGKKRTFVFHDDSESNYDSSVKMAIRESVNNPSIKIVLAYVGLSNKERPAHAVVFEAGTARIATLKDIAEIEKSNGSKWVELLKKNLGDAATVEMIKSKELNRISPPIESTGSAQSICAGIFAA